MASRRARRRKQVVVLLAFALALAAPVAAQVPDNVPDGTTESLDEERKERFVERHRDAVARFFVGANLGVGMHVSGRVSALRTVAGVQQSGAFGLRTNGGGAFVLTFGRYQLADGQPAPGLRPSSEEGQRIGAYTYVALQYEIQLRRWSEARLAERIRLGVGVDVNASGVGRALGVSVMPQYALPVNQSFSLPVGLRVGSAVLGPEPMPRFYVGPQVGVRVHFGPR